MNRRTTPLAALTLATLSALSACSRTQLVRIRDTEGREFTQTCKRNLSGDITSCTDLELAFMPLAADTPTEGDPSWGKRWTASGSTYEMVCDHWYRPRGNYGTNEFSSMVRGNGQCRLVVCGEGSECNEPFVCHRGLCRMDPVKFPEERFGIGLTKTFCLAGYGGTTETPEQLERVHLAEHACVSLGDGNYDCKIPAACERRR